MSFDPTVPFTPEYLAANKGPQILKIIIVFPVLALIIVGFRIYTRVVVVRNSSYEDLAIVAALIFSIGSSICQGFQVKNGSGRHVQALTMEDGIRSLKALFASIMMYNLSMTLIKFSIILQYIRIAIDESVRTACKVVMWINFATCFEAFVIGLFSCYPIAKFWDDRIPGGCIKKPVFWYVNAGIGIVIDIALIIIPIFIIKKLQLRSREKYTLALILGLGGFACIASVLRLEALHKIENTKDITWDNPGTVTWSAIELNVGIICASLPTLRAFVIKHFPRIFRSTWGSTPNAKRSYTSGSRSGKTPVGETDESELVYVQARRASLATTNISNISGDLEKGGETFLASDSEREYQQTDLSRTSLRIT